MSQHNILITGANGLLGKHFLKLYNTEHNIHAIVRNKPKQSVENVTYHIVDFSNDWSINDLPSGIDTICHLAQSDSFRDFPDKALDVFDVNIASTAKLLDYGYRNKVKNFIYASSGGVYANTKEVFKENSPIAESNELGYYLGSKRCSEILASNYSSIMNVSILRFFFIYGAEQKRSMLLPRLVDNIKNGIPITLQGDEGLSINPIHATDAAKAVAKTVNNKSSSTFNIAGKNAYSLKEISHVIGCLIGKEPIFEYQDTEAQNIVANIGAMEEQLHIPEIDLKQGLLDLI